MLQPAVLHLAGWHLRATAATWYGVSAPVCHQPQRRHRRQPASVRQPARRLGLRPRAVRDQRRRLALAPGKHLRPARHRPGSGRRAMRSRSSPAARAPGRATPATARASSCIPQSAGSRTWTPVTVPAWLACRRARPSSASLVDLRRHDRLPAHAVGRGAQRTSVRRDLDRHWQGAVRARPGAGERLPSRRSSPPAPQLLLACDRRLRTGRQAPAAQRIESDHVYTSANGAHWQRRGHGAAPGHRHVAGRRHGRPDGARDHDRDLLLSRQRQDLARGQLRRVGARPGGFSYVGMTNAGAGRRGARRRIARRDLRDQRRRPDLDCVADHWLSVPD